MLPRRYFRNCKEDRRMNPKKVLQHHLEQCPLIAIIRGVTPGQVEEIGAAIFDAGITIIEVPLNSPDPLQSIEMLATRFGEQALVGAGTVLRVEDVQRVKDGGRRILVSPDTNKEVIAAAAAAGLVSSPGYFSPSEAFGA